MNPTQTSDSSKSFGLQENDDDSADLQLSSVNFISRQHDDGINYEHYYHSDSEFNNDEENSCCTEQTSSKMSHQ
jgi:hypothetical protein